jgi:hypothetical protein
MTTRLMKLKLTLILALAIWGTAAHGAVPLMRNHGGPVMSGIINVYYISIPSPKMR